MRYTYTTESAADRIAVITYLQSKGYKWHGENGWTAERAEQEFPYANWPTIGIDIVTGQINGTCSGSNHIETGWPNLVSKISEMKFKTIDKFAGTYYAATITKELIKVGCQTITKEDVEGILKNMNEVDGIGFHITPSDIYVLIPNQSVYEFWMLALENLGYKYAKGCRIGSISDAIEKQHWKNWKYLTIRRDHKLPEERMTVFGHHNPYNGPIYDNPFDSKLVEFVFGKEPLKSKEITVGSYTYILYNDKIVMKNDTITITKNDIEDVLKTMKELA